MSEDTDINRLSEDGRPKFTLPPVLEKIDPMPDEWKPRDHTPIGVEQIKPDAKSQRIADAFDIMDQKQNWLGDAVYSLNQNLVKVMAVAEEALRLGIVANRRQDADEEKPFRALWQAVRTIGLVVMTAAITVIVERMLKK